MRRLVIRLHRWLGLSVGLVFVLIGLSGTILAYAPAIEDAIYPVLARPLPANWRTHRARVLATLERRHPDDILIVRFPGSVHSAYQLYLTDGSQIYVDPTTGQTLVSRAALGDPVMIARALHTELLAGATGERVLGWLGFAMLALLATAVWTWWPRRGGWRANFKRPRSMRLVPQLAWWHKTVGVAGITLLAFITLTGVALIFYLPTQAVLTATLGGRPPSPPVVVTAPATGSIDWPAVFATLDRALPQGRTVYFYPPHAADAPLRFRKRMPGELHPYGRSVVELSRDGRLVYAHDVSAAGAGMRATNDIYPLHSGRAGSPVWRIIVAAVGVAPLFFFVTGLWLWYSRRNKKRPAIGSPLLGD